MSIVHVKNGAKNSGLGLMECLDLQWFVMCCTKHCIPKNAHAHSLSLSLSLSLSSLSLSLFFNHTSSAKNKNKSSTHGRPWGTI